MCITLKAGSQQNYITVSNIFIDNYMPQANGEFVKIYLYLLRCMADSSMDLSITTIADKFDQTEKDVNRALRYFAGKGLISIEYDENDELCAITFLPVASEISIVPDHNTASSAITSRVQISSEPAASEPDLPKKPVYTADMIRSFTEDANLKDCLYYIQGYTGPLSSTGLQTIFYLYDSLHFSCEMIEYLVESCAARGKKSMRYIETVALSWASSGITTVEEAKAHSGKHSQKVYSIMKAFGLNDRNPAPAELNYINTWYDLGFDQDIIIEACNRTIQTIHKPSFDYTDTILQNWKNQNVKKLEDIAALDLQHTTKKASPKVHKTAENKFNNHPHNPYDQENLQKIFQTM